MAVTITWTNTEPAVEAWSEEQTLTRVDSGGWRARVRFSIARITGTRNVAIRAVVGLRGDNSLSHNAYGTPQVRLTGEEAWVTGTTKQWEVHNTTWSNAAPQYAVIEGSRAKAQFDCGLSRLATVLVLDSPVSAPELLMNVGGEILEAEAVYVGAAGAVVEADGVFLNIGGEIVEA